MSNFVLFRHTPIIILGLAASSLILLGMAGKSETTTIMTTDSHTNPAQEVCETACGLPTSDAELRKILSPEQYRIMKENGTERPFANAYWDHKEVGLYVDPISGEALFASTHKYNSGTGWPSFWQPAQEGEIVEVRDESYGMIRTEVRAKTSDSHLGHVFPDGPQPTGLRYCINSASLRFVPLAELEEQGYAQYQHLFE